MSNEMNMALLQKIAKLGNLGYVPCVEIPAVVVTTNAPDDEISHLRPRSVLVTEDGLSYVDARIMHELEQDLSALISACGINTYGKPLHEMVPYAAERVGMLGEHYATNPPESEEPTEDVEEEVPEDANTD